MSSTRRVLGLGLISALCVPTAARAAEGSCPFASPPRQVFSRPFPDPDQEVGPFGVRNQRVQGLGLDVRDGVLRATVLVEEMKEQVHPGFESTFWLVHAKLGAYDDPWRPGDPDDPGYPWIDIEARYTLLDDQFTYLIRGSGVSEATVTGEPTMGPGGGVSISVPLKTMRVAPGSVLSGFGIATGGYTEWTDPVTGTTRIRNARWFVAGPDFFPMVPCPGASLQAAYDPNAQILDAEVWALPQGPATATLEELVDGVWTVLSTFELDEDGRGSDRISMDSGPRTFRVRVATELGDVLSLPQTVGTG